MIKEINGIVVSCKDFKETSKLVDIITPLGIISFVAKGVKSLKSPNRLIGNLIYAKFYLKYKENSLSNLVTFDVINDFRNIRCDYDLITTGSLLVNIAKQTIKQEVNEDIFNILVESLNKINSNYNHNVIFDIACIKYLSYLGVPIQKYCIKCGSRVNICTISLNGLICKKCRTNEYIVNDKTLKYIMMFDNIKIEKIKEIKIDNVIINEIHKFVLNYYEKYTGIYMKKGVYE